MALFDKELVRRRFADNLEGYDRLSVVQRDICNHFAKLLYNFTQCNTPPCGTAYEIGAGTGFLTKFILNDYPSHSWVINDITSNAEPYIAKIADLSAASDVTYQWCDAESMPLEDNIAMVLSCSAMQWFVSLEEYIAKVSRALAKGGIFGFTIYGERNFYEVRTSSGGIGLEYPTIKQIELWGQANGLSLEISEDYTQTEWFDSPSDVLNYIKQSGMNGNGSRRWTKQDFEEFCERYNHHFKTEKGVPLTFNPLLFIFKKIE